MLVTRCMHKSIAAEAEVAKGRKEFFFGLFVCFFFFFLCWRKGVRSNCFHQLLSLLGIPGESPLVFLLFSNWLYAVAEEEEEEAWRRAVKVCFVTPSSCTPPSAPTGGEMAPVSIVATVPPISKEEERRQTSQCISASPTCDWSQHAKKNAAGEKCTNSRLWHFLCPVFPLTIAAETFSSPPPKFPLLLLHPPLSPN